MIVGMVSFISILGMSVSLVPEGKLGWASYRDMEFKFYCSNVTTVINRGPFARKILAMIQDSKNLDNNSESTKVDIYIYKMLIAK